MSFEMSEGADPFTFVNLSYCEPVCNDSEGTPRLLSIDLQGEVGDRRGPRSGVLHDRGIPAESTDEGKGSRLRRLVCGSEPDRSGWHVQQRPYVHDP